MKGTAGDPGIIPLAVREAFRLIGESPDREFLLRVSYMEVGLRAGDAMAGCPAAGPAAARAACQSRGWLGTRRVSPASLPAPCRAACGRSIPQSAVLACALAL